MDIKELIRHQIEEEKSSMIYVVLKDSDKECLFRYKHDEKENLIETLKNYKYLDTRLGIPRFEKKAKRNVTKTA